MCLRRKKERNFDSDLLTNIRPLDDYKKAYYDLLSILEANHYTAPITAAFLYIITDFIGSDGNTYERQRKSAQVFSFLETEFSASDLIIFDKTVNILGAVIRGTIKARGDWLLGNAQSGDWLHNIWLCYGDLLQNQKCLENYEGAPVCVLPILDAIFFTNNLRRVNDYILNYIKAQKTFCD